MSLRCIRCDRIVAGSAKPGVPEFSWLCDKCRTPADDYNSPENVAWRARNQAPRNPTTEDPLCEDCQSPLSEHTGAGGSHPWNACRHFVPIGPKE